MAIERDRYGRPMILPPKGKEKVPYTRATTIANSLDDASALVAWKMRMAAIGLTTRPDLLVAIMEAGTWRSTSPMGTRYKSIRRSNQNV